MGHFTPKSKFFIKNLMSEFYKKTKIIKHKIRDFYKKFCKKKKFFYRPTLPHNKKLVNYNKLIIKTDKKNFLDLKLTIINLSL